MLTAERILRIRRVVEMGVGPSRCGVTDRAVGRPSKRDVVRVLHRLELREMASHAVGRQRGVVAAYVTARTLHRRMRAG